MTEILDRDRLGKCEGECEDRVREGEEEQNSPVCLAVMYKNIYPANKWLDYKCIAGTKA
jgi:hypothetical protein